MAEGSANNSGSNPPLFGLNETRLFAQRWFMTLFADVVPRSGLEPLWTHFVCFGWPGILRFCVQMLIDMSPSILEDTPDDILFETLAAAPSCLEDMEDVIQRSWMLEAYFAASSLLNMEREYLMIMARLRGEGDVGECSRVPGDECDCVDR